MPLAFFEEQFHDIDVQFRRLGQGHPIRRRGTGRRLSDAERGSVANRNDLGDRGFPVEHRDGFTPPDGTEVLAEPSFQLGDSHLFHSHIMTRTSRLEQVARRDTSQGVKNRRMDPVIASGPVPMRHRTNPRRSVLEGSHVGFECTTENG